MPWWIGRCSIACEGNHDRNRSRMSDRWRSAYPSLANHAWSAHGRRANGAPKVPTAPANRRPICSAALHVLLCGHSVDSLIAVVDASGVATRLWTQARRRAPSAIVVTGCHRQVVRNAPPARARPLAAPSAAPVDARGSVTDTHRTVFAHHRTRVPAYRRTGPGISTAVEVDGCADVQASGAGEIARSRHRARREGRIAKRRRAGILFDVDATLAHHATLRTAIRVRRTLKCVGAIAELADASRSLKTARARFEIARRSKAVDHARLRDGRGNGDSSTPPRPRRSPPLLAPNLMAATSTNCCALSKPRASSSCGSCDTMSEPVRWHLTLLGVVVAACGVTQSTIDGGADGGLDSPVRFENVGVCDPDQPPIPSGGCAEGAFICSQGDPFNGCTPNAFCWDANTSLHIAATRASRRLRIVDVLMGKKSAHTCSISDARIRHSAQRRTHLFTTAHPWMRALRTNMTCRVVQRRRLVSSAHVNSESSALARSGQTSMPRSIPSSTRALSRSTSTSSPANREP